MWKRSIRIIHKFSEGGKKTKEGSKKLTDILIGQSDREIAFKSANI